MNKASRLERHHWVYRCRGTGDPRDRPEVRRYSAHGVAKIPERQDLRNHSPSGFAWGYEGSGPSQLALAILCDYLGSDALALSHYQEFKRRVIAAIPLENETWAVSGETIENALEAIAQAEQQMEMEGEKS